MAIQTVFLASDSDAAGNQAVLEADVDDRGWITLLRCINNTPRVARATAVRDTDGLTLNQDFAANGTNTRNVPTGGQDRFGVTLQNGKLHGANFTFQLL